MKLKYILPLCLILLLASCQPGSEIGAIQPPITPLHTATLTPTTYANPRSSPVTTPAPEIYAPIDASTLPHILQEFLSRYDSFEDLNANVSKEYHFIATEVNRRPSGSVDSSPMVALIQRHLGLFRDGGHQRAPRREARLQALPAGDGHSFFFPAAALHPCFPGCGNREMGLQRLSAGTAGTRFDSINDLADYFILNHPVESHYYDFWYLVDLTKIDEEYGMDWRTTTKSIRIREKIIVDTGVYIPER